MEIEFDCLFLDKAGIQFQILNWSKGAAVWVSEPSVSRLSHSSCAHTDSQGPRAQIDRKLYKRYMQDILCNYHNLEIHTARVHDLVFDHSNEGSSTMWGTVRGVRLGMFLSLILFPFILTILLSNRYR